MNQLKCELCSLANLVGLSFVDEFLIDNLDFVAEYFGYQVWANYYGFLTSGQKSASWTRLLTAGYRDDLPDHNKGLVGYWLYIIFIPLVLRQHSKPKDTCIHVDTHQLTKLT